MHSSTVTVAIMGDAAQGDPRCARRAPSDFRIDWVSGTGCGGQHRNKHANSARVTHLPTGTVRTAQTRSRVNSLQEATAALNEALDRLATDASASETNGSRRACMGTGERSDKRRTYRYQDGWVVDHVSGKRAPIDRVMAGGFDLMR